MLHSGEAKNFWKVKLGCLTDRGFDGGGIKKKIVQGLSSSHVALVLRGYGRRGGLLWRLRLCCNEDMKGRCGRTKVFSELQRSAEAVVVVARAKNVMASRRQLTWVGPQNLSCVTHLHMKFGLGAPAATSRGPQTTYLLMWLVFSLLLPYFCFTYCVVTLRYR